MGWEIESVSRFLMREYLHVMHTTCRRIHTVVYFAFASVLHDCVTEMNSIVTLGGTVTSD